MEPLVEPIYVDHARLDSYYEQIVARPKTRRVPTYSINAGIVPSVNIQGSVQSIPASLTEKLSAVTNYLSGIGALRGDRPVTLDRWDLGEPSSEMPEDSWRDLKAPFRREICELRTLVVPPQTTPPMLEKGLVLWVADGNPLLYLIENFPFADRPVSLITGYTLLAMLSQVGVLPRLWQAEEDGLIVGGPPTPPHLLRLLSDLGEHLGL
ncbi:hypothetical protein Psuf_010000 [Phytohabitans suffuscus]|uniref:Uncharacterized protein n=1 Tax=Phytohabitans suffuscus TaxID=624315 RepID=A0A6F8YC96_9ACTN|nr:hypothetical protein [Phytohabitans suffuscus]BCB83687.1 hypothetical protein Psuf_010000 [Phytohabitans suffuscus]